MNAQIAIYSDFALVCELAGKSWLYIRRPFESLPVVDDPRLARLLPDQLREAMKQTSEHVAQRQADQAFVRLQHQRLFDVPYLLEFDPKGALVSISEARQPWERICADLWSATA